MLLFNLYSFYLYALMIDAKLKAFPFGGNGLYSRLRELVGNFIERERFSWKNTFLFMRCTAIIWLVNLLEVMMRWEWISFGLVSTNSCTPALLNKRSKIRIYKAEDDIGFEPCAMPVNGPGLARPNFINIRPKLTCTSTQPVNHCKNKLLFKDGEVSL